MTSSGTATYNPTIITIVDEALRSVGAIGDDETTAPGTSTIYTNTVTRLNLLIKSWQAMGMHVWTEEEAILFLQPGQYRYVLGTDASGAASVDNACDWQNYSQTTVAANAAQGANTVQLSSAAGFANGEQIGIQLYSGAMFWTSINGAPAGNVVTLSSALPGPVSAGGMAFNYSVPLLRPLRLIKARSINFQGPTPIETPLKVLSRQEFMDLPQKNTPGQLTQVFYAPKIPQGELYIWNVPPLPYMALRFTWLRAIYDVTAAAQTVDFPAEWVQPLIWALAEQIGPKYGVDDKRWAKIIAMAQDARDMAMSWDRESEDVQFGMDWDA